MKKYMAHDGTIGAEEGACLVFANNARQAKKLAYPTLNNWFGIEYMDVRVKWIKNAPWLDAEATKDIPHVIESPKSCISCEKWGRQLNEKGLCDWCCDDEDES